MKQVFLRTTKRLLILAVIVSAAATTTVFAQADAKQTRKDIKEATKISRQATEVFNGIMNDADKAIPKELLDRAEAVAIFPGVVKAAFIVGGRGGLGLVSRRTPTGWSAPAFFKMAGGSVGAQIGANKTDYILLIMNDGGLKGLLEDKFEMGGEVGIAAGPYGRTAAASTNATLDAGILTYSQSKGLFAGAAFKGGTITPDNDRNRAVYNSDAKDVLSGNSSISTAPAYVRNVPTMLDRYSTRKATTSANF
jgi:lipid-binding SYLF domain-containing protein